MKVWLDSRELLIRPVLNVRPAISDDQVMFDWPTSKGNGEGALVMASEIMEHGEAMEKLEKIMAERKC